MLAGSCGWRNTGRYENRMPKCLAKLSMSALKPFCCPGYKTAILILWSTRSRILLQRIKHFWYKLPEMCLFIVADQNLVEFLTSSLGWLICIFQKLEYLWNKKRYSKVVNIILPLTQTTSLFFFSKVAEHSFQVPMPNTPWLLNYLWFGARFCKSQR